MRKLSISMLALVALCGSPDFSKADGDAGLEYQFKGVDRAFYKLTEKIEDDKGVSVTIAYVGFEPKPFGKQLELTYAASMSTRPMAAGGVMPEIPPNPNLFEHDWKSRVTIDHLGKVEANQSHQDTGLPGAIAQNWQVALPELGAKGQNNWQSTRTIAVVSRSNGTLGRHFGSPMQTGSPVKADIKTSYTLHTPAQGQDANAPAADFTVSMDTQGNTGFAEHASGSGSFVFDYQRGLVQSLNEKLDATATLQGKDEHATITVDLQVLDKDQVDRLIADAKTQMDELQKLKDRVAAQSKNKAGATAADGQPTEKDHTWIDQLDFPAGTIHTDFVGNAGGGSPFVKAGDGSRPMIGLRYHVGNWGHPVIGGVEPLYDKPDDMHPNNETILLAKDGYVVGGFWANAPDGTTALRVIFMKKTATGVDPKDAYVSPWISQPKGEGRIKLGCTGEWVVGLFGRQGMNTDAFGLVLKAAAGSMSADPTDDPNYTGTNAPAKPPAK